MPIYADKKIGGKLTGRWRVEVQKGSLRLRGRFNSYEEAQSAEEEFRSRLESGEAQAAKRRSEVPVTIGEGYKKAAASMWRGTNSEHISLRRLEIALEIIGLNIRIESINTSSIDRLVEKLYERGVSDATINRYLSCVHKWLKWCHDRDYYTPKRLPEFPWKDEDEGRIRWITHSEEYALMDLLPEDIGKLVRIAIRTGMRRGEILGLRKENLQDGWVHLWKTKTGVARSIPVTQETFDDLMYLVTNNKIPNAHSLRYAWEQAREAMGLADDREFVFHACRHTCATRMVQANINIRVIQKFLGHKRIETTLRYAKVSDEMLTEALVRYESHLDGRKVTEVDTSPTVLIAPALS